MKVALHPGRRPTPQVAQGLGRTISFHCDWGLAVRVPDNKRPTHGRARKATTTTCSGAPLYSCGLASRTDRLHVPVLHVLGNATYAGIWVYGKYRHISTEDGMKIYD